MPEKKEDLSHNQKFLLMAFKGMNWKFYSFIVNTFLEGFDKNGDGKVSMSEFLDVMKRTGKIKEEHVKEMLHKGDLDGDG